MRQTLRIGTRGSRLALWQADHIADRLTAAHPGLACERVIISTRGDAILDRPLAQVGGKGLFVKELEEAMLAGDIDLAVHSMKDMPSHLPDGLVLGPVPARGNPRDAWVRPMGAEALTVAELPHGAVVGTSSLRRAAQLKARRHDLEIVSLRGNVETRLRKLDAREGGLAAIVLACAGLERLGLADRVTRALSPAEMLPAVGQGALALEHRADDARVADLVAVLHDPDTAAAVAAERALLVAVDGNCRVPIAGYATVAGDTLTLDGLVAHPESGATLADRATGPVRDAASLGAGLGARLLAAGGRELLAAIGAHP